MKGEIIGSCRIYHGPSSVWIWTPNLGYRDLVTIDNAVIIASNSAGQYVGDRVDAATGQLRAFLWSVDSSLVDIDTRESQATAISEDGVVGGLLGDGRSQARAVIWVPQKR